MLLLCNSSNCLLYTSSKLKAIVLIPLSLAYFLPRSCSATVPPIPTQALGYPAHFTSPSFFSSTCHSLPTTHLFYQKHIMVSLLDSSSFTNTIQSSRNDRALKCWVVICCFSSDLIISIRAFTLPSHNLEIFFLGQVRNTLHSSLPHFHPFYFWTISPENKFRGLVFSLSVTGQSHSVKTLRGSYSSSPSQTLSALCYLLSWFPLKLFTCCPFLALSLTFGCRLTCNSTTFQISPTPPHPSHSL